MTFPQTPLPKKYAPLEKVVILEPLPFPSWLLAPSAVQNVCQDLIDNSLNMCIHRGLCKLWNEQQ